jgi:hypothetical protein
MANIGLQREKLAQQYDIGGGKPLSDTQVKDLRTLNDGIVELEGIINTYNNAEYKGGFGIGGAIRRNPVTSRFDPLATKMRQDIDLFRKTVAKAKEGGRLTDQDQKYYDKSVLNPSLTQEQFLSLARELQNKLATQRDSALDLYAIQGKNTQGFVDYFNSNKNTNQGTTKSGIKYKVVE